jgi:hypothetical protein
MRPRLLIGGLLLLALMLGTTRSRAGVHWFYPVHATSTSSEIIITGAIGSVRNDTTTDYIGCWEDISPAIQTDGGTIGGTATVTCTARTLGVSYMCASVDPGMVKMAQSINGDSYIEFHAWQNQANAKMNGSCSYLQVQNYSVFEPKGP